MSYGGIYSFDHMAQGLVNEYSGPFQHVGGGAADVTVDTSVSLDSNGLPNHTLITSSVGVGPSVPSAYFLATNSRLAELNGVPMYFKIQDVVNEFLP